MLRPYQIENKIQIDQAFDSGVKALINCMPTGAGKTVSNKGWRVTILRQEKYWTTEELYDKWKESDKK